MENEFNILEKLQTADPLLILLVGGVFIIFLALVIFMVNRGGKKTRANAVQPRFVFHSYQISPLGNDGLILLKNEGFPGIVQKVEIRKRKDLKLQNPFLNFRVDQDKTYRVFLETINKDKMDYKPFEIQLAFTDQLGNQYLQSFQIVKKEVTTGNQKISKYA